MASRGTCAGLRARPGLARNLRRLLVAAGAGAACWCLAVLLASAAHASEASGEDAADIPDPRLPATAAVELDRLMGEQVATAERDGSGLLGAVTDTTLGTVERTAGDLAETAGDTAGETAQAGLDDVIAVLPSDPPEEPAKNPPPASQEPAQRTQRTPAPPAAEGNSQPQRQPRQSPDRGIEPARAAHTSSPTGLAAEPPTTRPAEQRGPDGRDAGREHPATQRTIPASTSAAGSDSLPQAPGTPALPSVPGNPVAPATGTTHAQDSAHSGKQPGVLATAAAAAVRSAPITTGGERASCEAGGIPARPGASPD